MRANVLAIGPNNNELPKSSSQNSRNTNYWLCPYGRNCALVKHLGMKFWLKLDPMGE